MEAATGTSIEDLRAIIADARLTGAIRLCRPDVFYAALLPSFYAQWGIPAWMRSYSIRPPGLGLVSVQKSWSICTLTA